MDAVRLKNTKKYCVPTLLNRNGKSQTVKLLPFQMLSIDPSEFTVNTQAQIRNGILRVFSGLKLAEESE